GHTRFSRDWSSDVCSSDLHTATRGQTPTLWPDFQARFSRSCKFSCLFLYRLTQAPPYIIQPFPAAHHRANGGGGRTSRQRRRCADRKSVVQGHSAWLA